MLQPSGTSSSWINEIENYAPADLTLLSLSTISNDPYSTAQISASLGLEIPTLFTEIEMKFEYKNVLEPHLYFR